MRLRLFKFSYYLAAFYLLTSQHVIFILLYFWGVYCRFYRNVTPPEVVLAPTPGTRVLRSLIPRRQLGIRLWLAEKGMPD